MWLLARVALDAGETMGVTPVVMATGVDDPDAGQRSEHSIRVCDEHGQPCVDDGMRRRRDPARHRRCGEARRSVGGR